MAEHDSVAGALRGKINGGNSEQYYSLIKKLRESSDLAEIRNIFLALGQHAALLSSNHERVDQLISLLFLYDWMNGREVCLAFEKILVGLVSSNAGFLEPVFQHLVGNFFPPEAGGDSDAEDAEAMEGDLPGDESDFSAEELSARSEQVHHALKAILAIVPLGCSSLLPVLFANFPRINESLERHREFLIQCFKVSDYVPIIRDRIFALAIERILSMDVEIHVDDIAESKGETSLDDSVHHTVFSMEEDGEHGKLTPHVKRVQQLADKVDTSLEIILDYVDGQFKHGRRAGKVMFELLMNIFDQMVLRTNNVKFTQFTIFYVCRRRPEFVDTFVERLLQRSLGDNEPDSIRLRASNYLASFLARALFAQMESTHSALRHMMDWIREYSRIVRVKYAGDMERGTFEFDPQDHIPYFAVCQAVVYILMFKGEDIGVAHLQELELDIMVESPLSPYVYMSTDVLEEFVRFSELKSLLSAEQNARISSYVQTRQKSRKQGVAVVDKTQGANVHFNVSKAFVEQVLATEYPFDPCLLKRTAGKLEPFYQKWLTGEGADHADAYQYCDKEIDRSASDAEDNQDEDYVDNETLRDAQARMPPPVHIDGLSSRAARMLTQLGGFAHASKPGDTRRDVGTPPNFWAFAFDPQAIPRSSSVSSYHDLAGTSPMAIQAASKGSSMMSESSASQASFMNLVSQRINTIPKPTGIEASLDDDDHLSGSW